MLLIGLFGENHNSLSEEKFKVLLLLRFVTVVDWWVTRWIHAGVYRREPQGSRATVQLMWKPCLPLPARKKCKGKVRTIMRHIFLSSGRRSIHNRLSRSYHLYLISHQQMGNESLICQHVGNFFPFGAFLPSLTFLAGIHGQI